MPEGDTIHRLANVLRPRIVGERVTALRLRRAEFALGEFVGTRVTKVEALGKHLLLHFDHGALLHAHMGMTGVMHCYGVGDQRRRSPANVAFTLTFAHAEVVGYCVPRVRVLRTDGIARDPVLSALGHDLLAADVSIAAAVRDLRRAIDEPIGVAIMDQRIAAGIGNVFKSEVLFRLKLDPFAPVRSFDDAQLTAILDEARALLRFNVDKVEPGHPSALADPVGAYRYRRTTRFDRTSPRRNVSVYGRKDEPCFDCGARIDMRRQGHALRSTYFCPACQNVTPLPVGERLLVTPCMLIDEEP